MSEFEGNDEISDEEKIQIAQHYLLSSPPGQYSEILTDVQKILPSHLLTDAIINKVARAYNIKNGKIVVSPSGNRVVLSNQGEIDHSHYIDPVNSSTFEVNHTTHATKEPQSIDETAETDGDGSKSVTVTVLESKRSTIQAAVSSYVSSRYVAEDSAGSVYAKDDKITICISGEKSNLRNYWSGKWLSTWTVVVGSSDATVSGTVKINAHYFEDGNLQLDNTKQIASKTIQIASDVELATALINHITTSESAVQSALDEMYTNMNEETFRAMRRVMPIIRTKMEWNINSVKMVRQIRK